MEPTEARSAEALPAKRSEPAYRRRSEGRAADRVSEGSPALLHRVPVGVGDLQLTLLLEDVGDLRRVADRDDVQAAGRPVLLRRGLRLRRVIAATRAGYVSQ